VLGTQIKFCASQTVPVGRGRTVGAISGKFGAAIVLVGVVTGCVEIGVGLGVGSAPGEGVLAAQPAPSNVTQSRVAA
jgi:hypothetical protein